MIRRWEDDNQRLEPELSFEIELEKYSQDRINKNKLKKRSVELNYHLPENKSLLSKKPDAIKKINNLNS